jgi:eukaryotic-like serine/threonine-protein kinase
MTSTDIFFSNIRWSPDSQHVAFAVSASNGQVTAIHVLDLATAQQKVFTVNNYRPYAWLDNTRLYVIQPQGTLLTSQQNLSLLYTSQIAAQPPLRLMPLASANALCGTFEKSIDSTQLFTSSCTPVNANGCQGPATQGPSTLSIIPATGGLSTTIYHSQNQAIMTLHPISSQTLLMYVENTSGNLSQNGLWKINTDGSDLTRLTTTTGRQCSDLGYPALHPQIASSGLYYALRVTDSTSQQESLLAGSLNGGAPTTFEAKDIDEGILILVGVVMQ